MKKIFNLLAFFFCLVAPVSSFSQEKESAPPDELIIAKKQVLYNLTEIIDKGGKRSTGFLFGLKSDSLILIRSNEKTYYSLTDLLDIEIECDRRNFKGVVIGSFAGAYLGNLILFDAEGQPTAYWDNEDAGAKAAATVLFAFVGGGIGYLIDAAAEVRQENFSFRSDVGDTEWIEELQRLKEFLIGVERDNIININFSLTQVGTRFSEIEDNPSMLTNNYYNTNYSGVTSFNLLRKIQVTYALLNYLDVGGSICWIGEPSFHSYSYNYSPSGSESINISQKYEAVGYYASAVYYPFKTVFPKILSWSICAGIGIADIDYLFNYRKTIENYPNTVEEDSTKLIDENVFSTIVSTQFDLYIINELSLGFVVDYIYVPGEMSAIPNTDIGERSLSNFSFGASLGFHF
jgi:hypothetical protein